MQVSLPGNNKGLRLRSTVISESQTLVKKKLRELLNIAVRSLEYTDS